MQRALSTWGRRGRASRLVALAGLVALSLPAAAAADWSKPPTTVSRHGESASFGAALGDDGLLRVPWMRGRTIGVALLSHGRVLRRFVVDRKPSPGRSTAVTALPGGRTVVQYESGSRIVLATFNRHGKRLHARRFSGSIGEPARGPLISLGVDGAAACWIAGRANDVPLSAALISPTGVIGQRRTVTGAAAAAANACSITRDQEGDAVVVWAEGHALSGAPRGRRVSKLLVRKIAPDGQLGPAITARSETEPGNVTDEAPVAAIAVDGTIGIGWTVSDGSRRAHHQMRWIAADGTVGPAIDLDSPSRRPGGLTLEPSGDGAVAIIVKDEKTVIVRDVGTDATVGPSQQLLTARTASYVSSTSNGRKVLVAVQAITRKRSSIYVIERDGLNWRKPARLASGGGANWPYGASVALNAHDTAGVVWSVERGVAPLASLGVRVVVTAQTSTRAVAAARRYRGYMDLFNDKPAHEGAQGDGWRAIFEEHAAGRVRYRVCLRHLADGIRRCWNRRTNQHGVSRVFVALFVNDRGGPGNWRARWLLDGEQIASWRFKVRPEFG